MRQMVSTVMLMVAIIFIIYAAIFSNVRTSFKVKESLSDKAETRQLAESGMQDSIKKVTELLSNETKQKEIIFNIDYSAPLTAEENNELEYIINHSSNDPEQELSMTGLTVDQQTAKRMEQRITFKIHQAILPYVGTHHKETEELAYTTKYWELASYLYDVYFGETSLGEGEIFPTNERARTFKQDYLLEDLLIESKGLFNESGYVTVSGTLDLTRNMYLFTVGRIVDNDFRVYQFSLIDDKFEEEKTARAVLTDRPKNLALASASIYDKSSQIVETYFTLTDITDGTMDIYTYSLLENSPSKINSAPLSIKREFSATPTSEELVGVGLTAGANVTKLTPKDISMGGTFDSSSNISKLIFGVKANMTYSEGVGQPTTNKDIIYYYEFAPLLDNDLEKSKLVYKPVGNEIDDYSIAYSWSSAYTAAVLMQATLEDNNLEVHTAIPLIDDVFAKSTDMSKWLDLPVGYTPVAGVPLRFSAVGKDISAIALTAFPDKASNTTVMFLSGLTGNTLFQQSGTFEFEAWDDCYQVADDVTSTNLEMASASGDISSVIAMASSKEVYASAPIIIPIEVVAYNKFNSTISLKKEIYEFKVLSIGASEYKNLDKKLDYRGRVSGDIK